VRIRKVREALKLKIAEFARSLNVPRSTLVGWEEGKTVSIEILKPLETTFDVNMNWLLTGEGEMFLKDESISRFDAKTHQGRDESETFKIPLLTREDAMRFDPDTEIPPGERKANSGEYPITSLATIPFRVMEYGTDLRAIAVFDSRMFPVLKSGDIAIIEATGWNGDGIYLYRMGGGLHIGYVTFVDGRFRLEYARKDEAVYDPHTFKAIGQVRAAVCDLVGRDKVTEQVHVHPDKGGKDG